MTLPRALRSIRTRLTLWYTGVLLVILLVIGGFSYQVLAWSLYQDVDASLVTVGRVIRDTGYADSGASDSDAYGNGNGYANGHALWGVYRRT